MVSDQPVLSTVWVFEVRYAADTPEGYYWAQLSPDFPTEEAARISAERLFFGVQRQVRIVRLERIVVDEYQIN